VKVIFLKGFLDKLLKKKRHFFHYLFTCSHLNVSRIDNKIFRTFKMNNLMRNLITLILLAVIFCFSGPQVTAQNYDNAMGIRAAWGFGGTFKHFFTEKIAAEGIVNYWNRGTLGFRYSRTRISALVQMHNDLSNVAEGLQWYAGGGAFVGFWGGNFSRYYEYNQTEIGVSGVLGLDYAFADLPINVSVDWMPSVAFVGGGFSASAGGIAVRYIF
jgi:hypothetical protein